RPWPPPPAGSSAHRIESGVVPTAFGSSSIVWILVEATARDCLLTGLERGSLNHGIEPTHVPGSDTRLRKCLARLQSCLTKGIAIVVARRRSRGRSVSTPPISLYLADRGLATRPESWCRVPAETRTHKGVRHGLLRARF